MSAAIWDLNGSYGPVLTDGSYRAFFDIVKRKQNVVFASFVRFAAVSPAADPQG